MKILDEKYYNQTIQNINSNEDFFKTASLIYNFNFWNGSIDEYNEYLKQLSENIDIINIDIDNIKKEIYQELEDLIVNGKIKLKDILIYLKNVYFLEYLKKIKEFPDFISYLEKITRNISNSEKIEDITENSIIQVGEILFSKKNKKNIEFEYFNYTSKFYYPSGNYLFVNNKNKSVIGLEKLYYFDTKRGNIPVNKVQFDLNVEDKKLLEKIWLNISDKKQKEIINKAIGQKILSDNKIIDLSNEEKRKIAYLLLIIKKHKIFQVLPENIKQLLKKDNEILEKYFGSKPDFKNETSARILAILEKLNFIKLRIFNEVIAEIFSSIKIKEEYLEEYSKEFKSSNYYKKIFLPFGEKFEQVVLLNDYNNILIFKDIMNIYKKLDENRYKKLLPYFKGNPFIFTKNGQNISPIYGASYFSQGFKYVLFCFPDYDKNVKTIEEQIVDKIIEEKKLEEKELKIFGKIFVNKEIQEKILNILYFVNSNDYQENVVKAKERTRNVMKKYLNLYEENIIKTFNEYLKTHEIIYISEEYITNLLTDIRRILINNIENKLAKKYQEGLKSDVYIYESIKTFIKGIK